MDIEEARRRLAAHPRKGDPTAEAGETLNEKAARLRAEQRVAQPTGDYEIVVLVRDVTAEAAKSLAWVMLMQATASPEPIAIGAPRPAAQARTEWGARFEDGLTEARPSREAAELTVRSIRGRHGTATLVQRQHTVTDWTDAEESP